MSQQYKEMAICGAMLLLCGCASVTRTVQDGVSRQVVPLPQTARIVFREIKPPDQNDPRLTVHVFRVAEERQQKIEHQRVEKVTELNVAGKAIMLPVALPVYILSFGQANLWSANVNEIERKAVVLESVDKTVMSPAKSIEVSVTGNGMTVVSHSDQDGLVVFDMSGIIRAAFENVQTTRLQMTLQAGRATTSIELDHRQLQAIYQRL